MVVIRWIVQVDYVAGGATQNSARVCQWMLKASSPNSVTYAGSVGADEFGAKLAESARLVLVLCALVERTRLRDIWDTLEAWLKNNSHPIQFSMLPWEKQSLLYIPYV